MNKRQLIKWREDYTTFDAPCLGEGLYLHCYFDEKDDVKRLGGRWNSDPSGKGGHWWMPKNQLDKDCPMRAFDTEGCGCSGTIRDWLNNYKMIAGQYGTLDTNMCYEAIQGNLGAFGGESTVYQLLASGGGTPTFEVHPDLDVVQIQSETNEVNWLNMRDARVVWNMMIQGGSRKVVRQEETV